MPSLVIRLPKHEGALSRIRRDRYVSLHGWPHKLKVPGGIVALAAPDGRIRLTARASRLVGPGPVKLLNGGSSATGYRLYLTKVTKPAIERRLKIRWYAVGQFRYFNAKTWTPVILGPVEAPSRDYIDHGDAATGGSLPSVPFGGSIPGRSHSDPEARLVREYVEWLGANDEFRHDYLRSERLYTDLFDKRYWRLIEAKLSCDRRNLRTALGQLLDYKRWYTRKPSLGVLVGSKPTPACLRFLTDCGVTVIWRTPEGRFVDSTENRAWAGARRVGAG